MARSVSPATATEDGSILIPPASQGPQYDADGNLRSDGVHEFTWDAENRLVKIETLAAAVTAGVPYRRVECVYDSQWRRVRRLLFDQPSATTPLETTRYLWAGWRCLAELGATDSVRKTLVWGLDSQQSLHLGDGNGALLWINDLGMAQSHFCHYDGNGNITGLSDASGAQTAEYLYNAFGELLERSGAYADKNLHRFSTKPFEEVGGLYYYGYRYYDPATGRWPSRDPIEESGGINLYVFSGNNGVNYFDRLGLDAQVIGEGPDIVGSGRMDWDLNKYIEWLEKRRNGKLSQAEKNRLFKGCIGLCQSKLNTDMFPEQSGDVKCYLKKSEALARKCDKGTKKIVFAKQGKFKSADGPKKNEDGSIPTDSVTDVDPKRPGTYNYVTRFKLKDGVRYGWMNHGIFAVPWKGPQMVSFDDGPVVDGRYPDEMWCAKCSKCDGGDGGE